MGKRKEKKQGTYEPEKKPEFGDPWISMRTGLIIVAVLSVAVIAWMGYNLVPALGWLEGILWALGFGASIWVIAVGFYFFNRLVRRR